MFPTTGRRGRSAPLHLLGILNGVRPDKASRRPSFFLWARLLSLLGSLPGVHLLEAGCSCLTFLLSPFPYSSARDSFPLLKVPHPLYALLQQLYVRIRENGTPIRTDNLRDFIGGLEKAQSGYADQYQCETL